MAENPYFSRIMDAVDLIVGDTQKRKFLGEQREHEIGMMNRRVQQQEKHREDQQAHQVSMLDTKTAADAAELQKKYDFEQSGLGEFPDWFIKLDPKREVLRGYKFKTSEIAGFLENTTRQDALDSHRGSMLSEKQKDRAERERHNKAMEGKSTSSRSVGSKDPTKRLEALRKEAVNLLKSGFYGDFMKESAGKDRVTQYVGLIDGMLKKLRTGKLSSDDVKQINDIESFLVYSGKQDVKDQKGREAVGQLTDGLRQLENELK